MKEKVYTISKFYQHETVIFVYVLIVLLYFKNLRQNTKVNNNMESPLGHDKNYTYQTSKIKLKGNTLA